MRQETQAIILFEQRKHYHEQIFSYVFSLNILNYTLCTRHQIKGTSIIVI